MQKWNWECCRKWRKSCWDWYQKRRWEHDLTLSQLASRPVPRRPARRADFGGPRRLAAAAGPGGRRARHSSSHIRVMSESCPSRARVRAGRDGTAARRLGAAARRPSRPCPSHARVMSESCPSRARVRVDRDGTAARRLVRTYEARRPVGRAGLSRPADSDDSAAVPPPPTDPP